MSHSLVQNYLHIVFTTKGRKPLIYTPHEEALYTQMRKICFQHHCRPMAIGGYLDHVHVLCNLSKGITLAKFMQYLKGSSSYWIKRNFSGLEDFYWQQGYGAFSVDYKTVNRVVNYIENQHHHHGQQSFQQEYFSFLDEHGVDYDPELVWE